MLQVVAQVHPADHVDVAVTLSLLTIAAEVGHNAKALGCVHRPHIHGQPSQVGQQAAVPHLHLRQVFLGHHQQHERRPPRIRLVSHQPVDDDHRVIVQITHAGRRLASGDLTEHAVGVGHLLRFALAGPFLSAQLEPGAGLRQEFEAIVAAEIAMNIVAGCGVVNAGGAGGASTYAKSGGPNLSEPEFTGLEDQQDLGRLALPFPRECLSVTSVMPLREFHGSSAPRNHGLSNIANSGPSFPRKRESSRILATSNFGGPAPSRRATAKAMDKRKTLSPSCPRFRAWPVMVLFAAEEAMLGLGVLTISTSGAQGNREDTSGQAIRDLLSADGFEVVRSEMIPDDYETIAAKMVEWADSPEVNLIVSTGGTGLTRDDVTPEACMSIFDREVPGMAEAMRAKSLEFTPMAMISRSVVGVRSDTLIITLPGSTKGVRECLEVVQPVLHHAVDLLRRETVSEHPL